MRISVTVIATKKWKGAFAVYKNTSVDKTVEWFHPSSNECQPVNGLSIVVSVRMAVLRIVKKLLNERKDIQQDVGQRIDEDTVDLTFNDIAAVLEAIDIFAVNLILKVLVDECAWI